MHLGWLDDVMNHEGEVASVHVDASRTDPQGEHTQGLHSGEVVGLLREAGAPGTVLDVVAERTTAETHEGGEMGRHLVVAADGEVLLDLLVAHRPERDEAAWGPVPCLLPLLRALDPSVGHVLVQADRTGADVTVVDPLGRHVRTDDVEGDHDVLHKVRGGGWSHRRMQSRVEDSWERNADEVVAHVRRLVERHHPEVVLLTGDPHACGLVREGLADHLGDSLRWVKAGGRADGVDADAEQAEVEDVLREVRLSRMAGVVSEFERATGQGQMAAAGLGSTVSALQRASVGTLLLAPDAVADRTLWTSPDGVLVGATEADVLAQGAGSAVEAPAVDVLVQAAGRQAAEVELVDGVPGVLEQGVGALLRFDTRPDVPTA